MPGRRRLIVGGLLLWEVTSPLRIPFWLWLLHAELMRLPWH